MNMNETSNVSPSPVSRRDMLAGTAGVLAASAGTSRAFAAGSKAGAVPHKPKEPTGAKTMSFVTTQDGTEIYYKD
jgi:non-heme chloroperoxidase